MPKCETARCLGHAAERTEEVTCDRCGQRKWILLPDAVPTPTSFTCQRCLAVLAGSNAVDPVAAAPSPAQTAAREALGKRSQRPDQGSSIGQEAPESPSGTI